MIRLIKEKRQLTVCGILVLILLEVVYIHAEKHTGLTDRTKHRNKRQTGDLTLMRKLALQSLKQRPAPSNLSQVRKRQAADLILMGYKAEGALRGTTKPSNYFNRIGRKRSNLYMTNGYNRMKNYLDQADDGLYIDDTGYDVNRW